MPHFLLGEDASRIDPSIHDVRFAAAGRSPDGNLLYSAIAGGPRFNEGNGGVRRDRTDDLMLAKHALYQLSYDPLHLRGRTSWEPSSICRPPQGSHKVWWAQADSNRRPHAYQACALTS